MTTRMRASGMPVIATACLLVAGGASFAQDQEVMTPEEAFQQLHEAVVAYERCHDIEFDQQQSVALNDRIMEIVDANLGAATKLSLIVEAKDEMGSRVGAMGCGDDTVAAHLELFDSQLGDVLGAVGN